MIHVCDINQISSKWDVKLTYVDDGCSMDGIRSSLNFDDALYTVIRGLNDHRVTSGPDLRGGRLYKVGE